MKSSSRLFPVQLISAEVFGNLAEDVYLIRPNNSPDQSVQIALSHITDFGTDSISGCVGAPIILLHGNHQNRRQWVSPLGEGIASRLLDLGYDVWLMEARGHGLSPVNSNFERNTLSDYGCYDIPAINAFVLEKTGEKPLWIGCREGAGALAVAMAGQYLKAADMEGAIFLEYLFSPNNGLKLPFVNKLKAAISKGLRFRPDIGPEPESVSIYRELWLDQGLFGYPGKNIGINIYDALKASRIPMALVHAMDADIAKPLMALIEQSVVSLISCPSSPGNIIDLEKLLKPWLNARGKNDEVLSIGEVAPAL